MPTDILYVYRHSKVKTNCAAQGWLVRLGERRAEGSGASRVSHHAEGIRETDWSESGASFLYGTRRKGNWGGDLAKDQSGVQKVDRVASYWRRLKTNLRRAVRGSGGVLAI